jgi:hypothetical protein
MNSFYLLSTCLALHLIALVTMAGITLADYFACSSLWKFLDRNESPASLLNLMARFPRIAGIGAAVLILTGFCMMALTHGVFGEQLWFRIKFGLVILLILNATLVGRRQSNKLRRILDGPAPAPAGALAAIRSGLNFFHLLQLSIFMLIIFLSIFKFN